MFLAEEAPPLDPFEPTKLDTLAKWSAAGFTALTSVLTFFGIKDGLLTRVLSDNQTAALWAFILIGAGVVLSLFGLAVKTTMHLYVGWLTLALLAMAVVSARLLVDFGESSSTTDTMLSVCLIGLLLVTLLAAVKKWKIVLGAALLVLAVAATSTGLYTAAKISVAVKAAPETMQVGAKLTGGDAPSLEVTLAGSKQNDGTVRVVGYRAVRSPETTAETGQVLWSTAFSADGSRAVAQTYTVPIDPRQWAELSVQLCTRDTTAACEPTERASYLAGAALTPGGLAGSLATAEDGTELIATLSAERLLASQRVVVRFGPQGARARAKVATVVRGTAVPDATGKVTWTAQLPHGGVRWALRAVVCDTVAVAGAKPCKTVGQHTIMAVFRPPRAATG